MSGKVEETARTEGEGAENVEVQDVQVIVDAVSKRQRLAAREFSVVLLRRHPNHVKGEPITMVKCWDLVEPFRTAEVPALDIGRNYIVLEAADKTSTAINVDQDQLQRILAGLPINTPMLLVREGKPHQACLLHKPGEFTKTGVFAQPLVRPLLKSKTGFDAPEALGDVLGLVIGRVSLRLGGGHRNTAASLALLMNSPALQGRRITNMGQNINTPLQFPSSSLLAVHRDVLGDPKGFGAAAKAGVTWLTPKRRRDTSPATAVAEASASASASAPAPPRPKKQRCPFAFCPMCGSKLPSMLAVMRFCPSCGYKLPPGAVGVPPETVGVSPHVRPTSPAFASVSR